MDGTAVNAIRDLAVSAAGLTFEMGGIQYSSLNLHRIDPPKAEALQVSTLSGFADAVRSLADERPLIQVVSPTEVVAISELDATGRDRETFVRAVVRRKPYPFGTFMELEGMIVALGSWFQEGFDEKVVLDVLSNVKSGEVKTVSDNGLAQTVVAKTGVARVGEAQAPGIVMLAPYRTFSEVGQPASRFLLRLRSGTTLPTAALFEADGGSWELSAIGNVRDYLQETLEGYTVIA